jgi:uncharacterized protein DUF5681
MDSNDKEKVGFGKPPKATQFKKGQSGNPRGRPKGRRNLATVLEKALREQVVINENGRRKTISKFEAAFKQLVNKAASGDLRALHQLAALVRSAEERSGETTAPTAAAPAMAREDQKVLENVLKRYGANLQGVQDVEDDDNDR